MAVRLHDHYVTPAGVDCRPVDFANNGWIVEFYGLNFAFTAYVSDADFASYIRVED